LQVPVRAEELLRHDRRAQPRLRERRPLAGLIRAAALEPLAHPRDLEPHDLLAVDMADLPVVVRDEPHRPPSPVKPCLGVRHRTWPKWRWPLPNHATSGTQTCPLRPLSGVRHRTAPFETDLSSCVRRF